MTTTTTKNKVYTLSPQDKKKETIKKNLECWKSILAIYDGYNGSSLEKEKKETREFVNKLEQELKRIEQEKETSFSIKNFLLEKSCLVQLKEKSATGKNLSKAEQAKKNRIYDLRDKVFNNMKQELAKYYQVVMQGDYRFDGMPEISGGIKGWAEEKIWRLLISLGEPNNLRYSEPKENFWTEPT